MTYLDHLEAGICESIWEEREENIWEMLGWHVASIHLSGCAESHKMVLRADEQKLNGKICLQLACQGHF